METIEILLASYNGEKYIEEMIESILAQDYQNWHLIVSDDQSTDSTAEILESFSQRYPERITHYRSGRRFGNAQNHFMHLLSEFHDAPYIMFCDQDDVWHKDKISKTLAKMKDIETPYIPAMVHTDLRVVDGNLQEIESSFMSLSGIVGDRMETKQLLVQNVVTGCTMMINHELANLAVTKLPKSGMLMHDHWIALIASACGTTVFLNEATIDYRQHGNNSVGAKNIRSLSHIRNRLKDNQILTNMQSTFKQAKAFEECFYPVLSKEMRKTISVYAKLTQKNAFTRKWTYLRYGYWKIGLLRRVGQIVLG